MRKIILILGTALAMAYTVVALSPIKAAIGRHSPRLGSFFSAPTFNFADMYDTGDVLEFQMGMSRQAFIRSLETNYANTGALMSVCGGDSGYRPQVVTYNDRTVWDELAKRPVVCLSIDADSLMLLFHFSAEKLSRIELS